MYAIVDIAGKQYKVEVGNKLYVSKLSSDAGASVSFDKVLLSDNDGTVSVGKPTLPGASVSATVVSHVRGDKVLVFKKKRRKGYRRFGSHRQDFTQIKIDNISI